MYPYLRLKPKQSDSASCASTGCTSASCRPPTRAQQTLIHATTLVQLDPGAPIPTKNLDETDRQAKETLQAIMRYAGTQDICRHARQMEYAGTQDIPSAGTQDIWQS